jgi:hypothetical protein
MDQEHEDYTDGGMPARWRRPPQREWPLLFLLGLMALTFAAFVLRFLVGFPRLG